jgi:zinc/manganese transport system substrate-binding protein/manganese/iron transport system substrate-binding protein
MRGPFVLAIALVAALVVAASVIVGPHSPAARAQTRQIRVVAGVAIVQDLVRRVGGDGVEAFSIVPPGADPHTYQPTPRDVQSLQGARLAVWNGLGLDDTAADLVAEQRLPDLTTVVLSDGITPLADDGAGDADEHDDGHGHEHAADNPHLWLDPVYAVRYVETIRDALSEVDPANAATYEANATAYIGEINALDSWAQGEIATIPAERRKLVTFHDAFPYFAGHYGLDLVGVVLKSPGREPSAQEVAALVTEMQRHQIPAVYAEPQFNARILELAARDAGVQVRRLYSDAFDSQVTTYLDLMRFNVTSVVEGLR